MAVDYEKAGVSLEAGYDVVRRIKKHVAPSLSVDATCFLILRTTS